MTPDRRFRLIASAPFIWLGATAQAQGTGLATTSSSPALPETIQGPRSDADIWRAIKGQASGIPSTQGTDAGVLVDPNGWTWAEFRTPDGPVVSYGGLVLGIILGLIVLFALLRGRMRIEGGRSGRRVARFDLSQRVVHWTMASVFLLMTLTGLAILFGRPVLAPLLGKAINSVIASAALQAHNLFGPIFIAALIALVLRFLPGNFPAWRDLRWLARGGGLFGGHAPAGRYNAGEKLWFWIATLTGLILSLSGVLLLFPDHLGPLLAQDMAPALGLPMGARDTLRLAEIGHVLAALVFIGVAMGHIYLGTYGTEGTLEGMTDGSVDENWARTHHDVWLEDIRDEGKEA